MPVYNGFGKILSGKARAKTDAEVKEEQEVLLLNLLCLVFWAWG